MRVRITNPPVKAAADNQRLAVLLSMAMFVLVVDTSLGNSFKMTRLSNPQARVLEGAMMV